MSEEDKANEPELEQEESAEQPEPDKDPAEEAEKWKALARKHEAQAKKNADAAKRLEEIEEAQKSEQERLAEQADKAAKRAAQAELDALRYQVAFEKGLSAELMEFLNGESREDLEAKADKLARYQPIQQQEDEGQEPPRRPRERMRPGATPSAEPEETDPRKLAAQLPRF